MDDSNLCMPKLQRACQTSHAECDRICRMPVIEPNLSTLQILENHVPRSIPLVIEFHQRISSRGDASRTLVIKRIRLIQLPFSKSKTRFSYLFLHRTSSPIGFSVLRRHYWKDRLTISYFCNRSQCKTRHLILTTVPFRTASIRDHARECSVASGREQRKTVRTRR